MNIDTPKPDSLNDGLLLKLIVNFYEIEHPAEDGRKSIAQILGVTVQHVDNCIGNRSCLGIEQWHKVISQSGQIAQAQFKLYLASCERRAKNGNSKPNH